MFRLKYLPHREPDEKIIFFLRRHPIIIVGKILFFLLLAIVPLAFYVLIKDANLLFFDNEIIISIVILMILTYYLFWVMLFYYTWLDYFLDIWIVTNSRIINIEQRGMFNRVVAEQKLFRIQDVMSEQKGVMSTLFNYGIIKVQTAGTEQTVEFEQVFNPQYIAQEIIKLVENHKKKMAQVIELEKQNEA